MWVSPSQRGSPHPADVNPKVIQTLRQLASEERTGILTCQGGKITRHLVFKGGAVSSARSSDDDERLGEVLVRHGAITQQHLDDASIFARKGKKLGEVLTEFNIIPQEKLEDAVRRQLLEVASNVLIDLPKKLAFNNTSDVVQVVERLVPVVDVIMEASRRVPRIEQHMVRLLRDDRLVALSKESFELMQAVDLKPHEAFILTRVNGTEPVRKVFDLSPLPEDQTARAVLGHLSVGILELREVPDEELASA